MRLNLSGCELSDGENDDMEKSEHEIKWRSHDSVF